jgi:hypothetical protein
MTAQVVAMNGYGVAISADSAVSLGSIRTFETAEKIYPLALPHRIAILHSGSVNFGGIPYPVLIADWKRQLPTKPHRDARAYKDNFIDWLEHHSEWFSDQRNENQFTWFVEDRIKRISEMTQEYADAQEEFDLGELLIGWTKECLDAGTWQGLKSQDVSQLVQEVKDSIQNLLDTYPKAKEHIENHIDLFEEYLSVSYSSKILEGSDFISSATLVFVGYGENDILPSYVAVDIAGVLKGKVANSESSEGAVSTDQNTPFGLFMPAQRDAMDSFLRGYDWDFAQQFIESASEHFGTLMSKVIELNDGKNSELEEYLNEIIENFEDDLDSFRVNLSEDRFLVNLRRSLSSLPIGSLANVVKALVEIQGLRQTTSAQFNSVGGPTDVAIIEPLEGFQWIQHKSLQF